jgi:HlyD family secretion protein
MLAELEPMRADVPDPRRRAEAEARISAAAANVRTADQRAAAAASSARQAESDLRRLRTLHQSGFVAAAAEERAASEVERSAAESRSAQFAVATARHELEAAQTALKFAASGSGGAPVVVRSPVDGRVLAIPRKSEGTVAVGQPLVEIGDPRLLEAEVDVLSADAVRIRPGTRVVFERWGGDGVLEGVVRVVEPAGFTKVSALGVEEQRVWVIVRFTSPARLWQRLGDRYRVEASFILWEGRDVLQLPASALFRAGDGWAAFVVQGGRAVQRAVRVGHRSGLTAEVLGGLKAGEQVVVHPDERVRDGVEVVARR